MTEMAPAAVTATPPLPTTDAGGNMDDVQAAAHESGAPGRDARAVDAHADASAADERTSDALSRADAADAPRLLQDTMDPAEYARIERRVRLKIDVQIVPLCLLLYFLSFLDRTNIGQARLSGLAEQLHLTDHDYNIALTVLYPPYIALEVPANLLLKRVGPRLWIPGLVVAWGIVSTLQGIVKTRNGLLINRAFLGAAEAGILPGIAVYLTFFYKPRELQLRQAVFFTGASLSGAFSGLLAAAISKMDGMRGLAGWSWIFILEGVFTIVVGLVCLVLLPNNIEKCWWLSPLERRIATERLHADSNRYRPRAVLHEGAGDTGAAERAASERKEAVVDTDLEQDASSDTMRAHDGKPVRLWLRDTLRTFCDTHLLLLCAIGFCCATPVYSISYFSPTIVKSMHDYSNVRAQLMSCPPFAVAFVYGVAMAFVSDLLQLRVVTALPGMVLSVVGFAMTYASANPNVRYGGVFVLTAGAFSLPPVLFAWIANNTAGYYKRATGLALLIVFTNCGGLASTWLFNTSEGPLFKRGLVTNMALSALGALLVIALDLLIFRERRLRAQGVRDHRVHGLRKDMNWSHGAIRTFLGDGHPEYHLEM
ncbi:hypothetical protein MSPP1_000485 [Malassezia sp. CBS 17886]|nr:hypothetical protein MSPP1_000485 [Malassezia sp. CBS 17886]